MEDQFFASFVDENIQIKTAAMVGGQGLLQSAGKSIGQFASNLKKGWKGEGLRGVTGEAGKVGEGIGGAYQRAKHGIQEAWKTDAGKRGIKAAGGLAAGAVGLGGAGYLHGRLSTPTVNINQGY